MAFTETQEDETLKKDWREDVSNQIADFLPGIQEEMSSQLFSRPGEEKIVSDLEEPQLGESFKIREIDIKRLMREGSAESLEQLVNDTGEWHHQVFIKGEAQGYAESCMTQNGKAHVCSLSLSPLAARIDQAIDIIDNYPDQVRFIVVRPYLNDPSFSLHAFWLVESKKVYLLEAPEVFMRMIANPAELVNEVDFIGLLREYCRLEELKFSRA